MRNIKDASDAITFYSRIYDHSFDYYAAEHVANVVGFWCTPQITLECIKVATALKLRKDKKLAVVNAKWLTTLTVPMITEFSNCK